MTRRAIDRHHTGVRIALTLALLGLLIAGCGGAAGGDRPNEDATLLLDFAPNAVHSGIYLATARGYDEAEGVTLEVRRPGASTDALKQLQTGRADMAILDIHDLGLARERGRDIVGVYAIVQRPLAAVIAQPGIERPRDLEGRRAGVTGLPSDDAVLRSVVADDGGDPEKVKATTIGFEAVKALLAGRVDAATAFWNAEGVALKRRRPGFKEFRVDDFGAPVLPRARPVRHPDDARGPPAARAGGDPRAAARLRAGPGRARQRRRRAARAGARERPGASSRRSSTPSRPPSRRAPARPASCARTCCASGRRGTCAFGILSKPLDVPRRSTSTRWGRSGTPTGRRRRSTSAAPSRAIRERGTTRSKPAASARRLVSASTCE